MEPVETANLCFVYDIDQHRLLPNRPSSQTLVPIKTTILIFYL